MHIRKAEIGDAQKIAEVILTTWKDAYRGIIPDDYLASMHTRRHQELFEKNISEGKEAISVLVDNGKVVGMASGKVDSNGSYDCELVAIYILPAYQKKGYGKQLFEHIVASHKESKCKSMIIWALKENRDRLFYEKLGGMPIEAKMISIGGKLLPLVGFVWQDINQIKLGGEKKEDGDMGYIR